MMSLGRLPAGSARLKIDCCPLFGRPCDVFRVARGGLILEYTAFSVEMD